MTELLWSKKVDGDDNDDGGGGDADVDDNNTWVKLHCRYSEYSAEKDIWGLSRSNKRERGENCIMKNFLNCTAYPSDVPVWSHLGG